MRTYYKHIIKVIVVIIIASSMVTYGYSSVLPNEFMTHVSNRSIMLIYKQDPEVKELGVRKIVIPTKIVEGPGNFYAVVEQDVAWPDKNGDFIYPVDSPEFDSVHTFAVVWNTMLMYRQDLEYLANKFPANPVYLEAIKKWDAREYGQLSIYPKSEPDEENAFYSRFIDEDGKLVRELRFFSFDGAKGRINTCKSLDIVAHEAGHSILDIFHPEYFDNSTALLGGFHESFGDMTAIFTALNQLDQCEALYADTKGDLTKQSFITELAEQFGTGIGTDTGLRNLQDTVTIATVDNEVHALSRVFTNAVYGILTDAYREVDVAKGHVSNGAEFIYSVSRYLRRMVVQAVLEVKKPMPTFSDFAYKMYDVAIHQPKTSEPVSGLQWASYIRKNFEARGIPVEENSTALENINTEAKRDLKARVCGTAHKHCK